MTNAASRLWTVEDVANYLAVPRSWLYDNWRREGIPAMKVGQGLRFRPADVERWLLSRAAA